MTGRPLPPGLVNRLYSSELYIVSVVSYPSEDQNVISAKLPPDAI